MSGAIGIYCDESCHLENDRIPVMMLGCIWTPLEAIRATSDAIRALKTRHGMSPRWESKWTKISPGKAALYVDLVDFFFDTAALHFRGLLVPNKRILNHSAFDQTHDGWYYKMLFTLLEPIIDSEKEHCVYLDIKDTRSEQKRASLERILRNVQHDASGTIIRRVQQIRSHESEVLQIADLLIGAVAYLNRTQTGDLKNLPKNAGKMKVIRRIQERSGLSLECTVSREEKKFNLLRWKPKRENGRFEQQS